jgi:predicted phage-related endonuclease
MKYTVLNCQQRSGDWFAARLGRITGSRAADLLATRKDKTEAAARRNYRRELVCERLTGLSGEEDVFVTREMQRGIDLEERAFAAYEAYSGKVVDRVGFVRCDELMAGSSVDGFVGDFKGVLELKCPKSTTHLQYVLGGVIPEEYFPQVIHHLWVTGADWCDFVSFDNRFQRPELQLFVRRCSRAAVAEELAAYEAAALKFLAEVEAEVHLLGAMEVAA